jgi:Flp pilus assembly protein TadB
MVALSLVGAFVAACLMMLFYQLAPPRESPLVRLGRFEAYHARAAHPGAERDAVGAAAGRAGQTTGLAERTQDRIGAWVAARLDRAGMPYHPLSADLAILSRDRGSLLGAKTVGAAGGFLVGLLALLVLTYGLGTPIPPGVPVVIAALLGAGLFLAPNQDVRKRAKAARRDFTEALATYLNLVSLEMSGRAAAETALPGAAEIGTGWPIARIRAALARARLAGEDFWVALERLGSELAIPELEELGGLVKQVSHDGAQVRDTLASRADAMRNTRLANKEAASDERNELLRLGQIFIVIAFMIFIFYPALVALEGV